MPDEHHDRLRIPERTESIDSDGTRLLRVQDGKALAQRTLHPGLSPGAAPGAIITLANAAAAAAGTSALTPVASPASGVVPVTMQLSVNLFREASRGILTAEAETIYRGRSTLIVDVKVRDEQRSLVATLVVTQLAPRSAAGPAPDAPRLAS
jgi:acyl-coenzyme A thioesterase PaaI-like protein